MVIARYKKELYPMIAIMKAAYHLLDRGYIHIDMDEDSFLVQVTAKLPFSENDLKLELDNEILAQAVRFHIYEQTHEIRDILVARAMASTIINAEPEEIIPQENDERLDEILTDWFDKHEN